MALIFLGLAAGQLIAAILLIIVFIIIYFMKKESFNGFGATTDLQQRILCYPRTWGTMACHVA